MGVNYYKNSMYIHIGNNNIVSINEVIGFFNYKVVKNNFENNFENENQLKVEKIKSIVITEKNSKQKNYISNISTNTLSKRKL